MTSVLPPLSSKEKFIDNLDVDSPEYIQEIQRDPEVKEDVKIMRERRRVSQVLKSSNFRPMIEKITASHMKNGQLSANVRNLLENLDYLTPHKRLGASKFSRCATVPVIPINDSKNMEKQFSKTEKLIRCKLASLYRLVDIFRWNTSQNSAHVTAKVGKDLDEYLIRCNGLLYNEVTMSSFLKVNLAGKILENGSVTGGSLDKAGWMLHSSIYAADPSIRCVIHLTNTSAYAISSLGKGILPLSQEAMILGPTAIYEMGSSSIQEEFEKISTEIKSKGEACRLLSVKHNGILAFGHSIEEAWITAYHAMIACEAQLKLSCVPESELVMPSSAAQKQALQVGRKPSDISMGNSTVDKTWRYGELEFEALMRVLDAGGFRTGHFYRIPQIKNSVPIMSIEQLLKSSPKEYVSLIKNNRSKRDELMVPPSTSSFNHSYYDKKLSPEDRIKMKSRSMHPRHWLNTPNGYKRTQMLEIGTANPKTITMWREDYEAEILAKYGHEKGAMSEGDDLLDETDGAHKKDQKKTKVAPKPWISVKIPPRTATLPPNMSLSRNATMSLTKPSTMTSGISEQVEDPNIFAPQGVNPREMKQKRTKVRAKYYQDVKDAGPRSKILDNIDDDFSDVVDASSPVVSPRGTMIRLDPKNPPKLEEGHVVLVGAVSKAIIKDDVRHNVAAYQTVYSPNPFDQMTDDDLDRYKANIERKKKGQMTLEEEEAMMAVKAKLAAEKAAEEKAHRERQENEPKTKDSSGRLKKSPHKSKSKKVTSDTSGDELDTSEATARKKEKKKRFKFPSLPKVEINRKVKE